MPASHPGRTVLPHRSKLFKSHSSNEWLTSIRELYLVNGVTTIRDPGGNLTLLRLTRQEINSGKRLGPRLFFAGYILDGNPPLWPDISIIADTPELAESAANFLITQGVDFLKVYNSITEP